MARGWESKSVELQVESAAEQETNPEPKRLTASQMEQHRRKQNLLLSRRRVVHQLKDCTNPLYQELLNRALADLDRQLAALE